MKLLRQSANIEQINVFSNRWLSHEKFYCSDCDSLLISNLKRYVLMWESLVFTVLRYNALMSVIVTFLSKRSFFSFFRGEIKYVFR